MNYEIGEVPKGWTRGDALRVLLPRAPNWRGALVNVRPYSGEHMSPEEVGAVEFTRDMIPRVQAWLDWWNGR